MLDNIKQRHAFHGLYRSLVNNMVIGVSEGYKKELELVGAGVFWHKCEVEGVLLNSLEELIKFFSKKANQETYSLEDQNGRVCTLNDLIRELSGK